MDNTFDPDCSLYIRRKSHVHVLENKTHHIQCKSIPENTHLCHIVLACCWYLFNHIIYTTNQNVNKYQIITFIKL